MAYRVFVSHFSGERPIADSLSTLIRDTFVGCIDPFISTAIPIGENWLLQIRAALTSSNEVLTIFTHHSVDRPWLNIETGYGVMAEIPTTPILFGGLTHRDLPVIYQLQQSVDERDDDDLVRLYTSLLGRATGSGVRPQTLRSSSEFVSKWRQRVSVAAARTPLKGSRPAIRRVIWFIGSHDGLDAREQSESLNVVRALAKLCFENRYQVVCGVSRLLEYLADSHEALATARQLPAETRGEPWRKALGSVHVQAPQPAPNPVIIVGTLRSENIRQRFNDAIGRIPDIAVVIGGRRASDSGRTHAECSAAAAAGIPILPIRFTGGAAAEITPYLNDKAVAAFPRLEATQGKLDDFAPAFLDVLDAQLDSGLSAT